MKPSEKVEAGYNDVVRYAKSVIELLIPVANEEDMPIADVYEAVSDAEDDMKEVVKAANRMELID